MKKTQILLSIPLLTLMLINTANSSPNTGAYVGAAAGINFLGDFQDGSNDGDSDILAGRIFGGYNFNKNIGIEVGYIKYANTTYSWDYDYNVSLNYEMQSVYLAGKFYAPMDLESKFSLYGLLGISYVYADVAIKYIGSKIGSDTTDIYTPIVGAGFHYNFNQYLSAVVEYTYTGGSGDDYDEAIPSASLLSFGLSYNFS